MFFSLRNIGGVLLEHSSSGDLDLLTLADTYPILSPAVFEPNILMFSVTRVGQG